MPSYRYRVIRNGKLVALSTTLREAQAEAKRIDGLVEPIAVVAPAPASAPAQGLVQNPEPVVEPRAVYEVLIPQGASADTGPLRSAMRRVLAKFENLYHVPVDDDTEIEEADRLYDWLEGRGHVENEDMGPIALSDIDDMDIAYALQDLDLAFIKGTPQAEEAQARYEASLRSEERKLSPIAHPDTPAFWAWFKHSHVVDAKGKPLVVYHGSYRGGFTQFDKKEIDAHHNGFFFTDDLEMAASYADHETTDRTPPLGSGSPAGEDWPLYASYDALIKDLRDIAPSTVFPNRTATMKTNKALAARFGSGDEDYAGVKLVRYVKGGLRLNPDANPGWFEGGDFVFSTYTADRMYSDLVVKALKKSAPEHLIPWRDAMSDVSREQWVIRREQTVIRREEVLALRAAFQFLYYWGMFSKKPAPTFPAPMLPEVARQLWQDMTDQQRLDMVGTFKFWRQLIYDKQSETRSLARTIYYYRDLFGLPHGSKEELTEKDEKLAKTAQWGYMLRVESSPGKPGSYKHAVKIYEDMTGEKKAPDVDISGEGVPLMIPLDRAEQASDEYKQLMLDAANGWIAHANRVRRQLREEDSNSTMAVFLSIQNPLVVDGKGAYWNAIPFMGKKVKTDDIAYYAADHGHDGVIMRNIKDYGSFYPNQTAHDVFVAFQPTQIKHATLNDGNFSETRADIRNPATPTQQGLLQRMLEDRADTFAKKVKWVTKHMPDIDDPQAFVGWVVKAEKKR